MYTPGTELLDGVIHPDAGLYERCFDIDKASDEHRNYISMLEKQGCTVHTVTNILLSMPRSRLVTIAEASLSYDVQRLPRRERGAQTAYKQQVYDQRDIAYSYPYARIAVPGLCITARRRVAVTT